MHSLRRGYGRALQGTVSMQKTCGGFDKVYSTESTPRAALRMSKDERLKVVLQFVAKYKDSNNGQLPGISVLRKEVGGKYEILKQILQQIKSDQEESNLEKPAGGSQGSLIGVNYSCKRQSSRAEASEKEKLLVSQVGRTTEINRDDNKTDSRLVAKGVEQRELLMKSGQAASQPIMYTPQVVNLSKTEPLPEFCLFISGVPALTTSADLRAAFEDCGGIFNVSLVSLKTPLWNLTGKKNRPCAAINFKTEEGLKAAKLKERVVLRGEVIDLKTFEAKEAKAQYHGSKIEA